MELSRYLPVVFAFVAGLAAGAHIAIYAIGGGE